MEESCKELTSFVTCSRTYQCEVLYFGPINEPATFQQKVNKVLHCIPFSRAKLGSVAVFSKLMDKHFDHLEKNFLLLGKHNLTLKLSKYKFAKSLVDLLGHIGGSKNIGRSGKSSRHTGSLYPSKCFVIKEFLRALWILLPIYQVVCRSFHRTL